MRMLVAVMAPVSELIDTLWNVNRVNTVSMAAIVTELIDTLWNVNRNI